MSTQEIGTVITGTWSEAEDDRLREAVAKHGSRWVLVAADVGTRNGEQCAKRWNGYVNPDLDHSSWSPQEDQRLLPIIALYGHNWKHIADNFLPTRAPLSIKNRYSLLMRRQKRQNARHQQRAMINSGLPSLTTPPSNDHPPCNLDLIALHSSSSAGSSSSPFFSAGSDGTRSNHTVDISDLFSTNTVPDGAGLASSGSGSEHNVQDAAHSGWEDEHSICNSLDASALFGSGLNGNVDDGRRSGPPAGSGDSGLEFSVTCSRARLKAMVCHVFEGAMSETAGLSEEEPVTVTLRLKN